MCLQILKISAELVFYPKDFTIWEGKKVIKVHKTKYDKCNIAMVADQQINVHRMCMYH